MDWLTRLENSANALAVLTAMITPTVLMSASGTLILSTSARLGRVVDRVRALVDKFEQLEADGSNDPLRDERRQLIFEQLQRQSGRARLLQRAMVAFYSSFAIFVACSIAIAVLAAIARNWTWTAVALGLGGALVMLYGALILIIESRMALGAIVSELEFVDRVRNRYGDGLADRRIGGPLTWLGRRIG